jgi:serine/threonine-protein kinase
VTPPPNHLPGISEPPTPSEGEVGAGWELPRAFGKYTLVRRRAAGGMAELFVALHKGEGGFEKEVIVKCILPELRTLGDSEALGRMLMHEGRIMAALSHSNIVQVFDAGTVEGACYLAMEHVHGEDLPAIVRQMRRRAMAEFPAQHAIAIILGLCAGLAHVHDRRGPDGEPLGIVHRDVSPQNVLVSFAGEVKLVDFGIAISGAEREAPSATGRPKGKLPYMSPEQARGEPVDARSDVFSAGVLLFELTTGRRLFKGATDDETLALLCERDVPRPSQVRPDYPGELESIVMRALARDRDERWGSAREMQAALAEFARFERLPTSPVGLAHLMASLFDPRDDRR